MFIHIAGQKVIKIELVMCNVAFQNEFTHKIFPI